jgi:hypothetical protein
VAIRSDPQRSAAAARRLPRHGHRAIGGREHPVDLGQEDRARRGELHGTRAAVHEAGTDIRFELLQRLAHRRLRHEEALGRPAEMELLGDGAEYFELTEIHGVHPVKRSRVNERWTAGDYGAMKTTPR